MKIKCFLQVLLCLYCFSSGFYGLKAGNIAEISKHNAILQGIPNKSLFVSNLDQAMVLHKNTPDLTETFFITTWKNINLHWKYRWFAAAVLCEINSKRSITALLDLVFSQNDLIRLAIVSNLSLKASKTYGKKIEIFKNDSSRMVREAFLNKFSTVN